MSAAPFRDSTDSLLRRIAELERENSRLRRRAHASVFKDARSFIRGLGRVVAVMIFVAGMMILGFIALSFVVMLCAGVVGLA